MTVGLQHRPGLAYDFDGNPVSLEEWGALHMDPRVRVGNAHVGPVRIATDWIGVDVSGDGRIYETMIFPRRRRDSNAEWSQMSRRYRTREEALAGHIALVNRVRARGVASLLIPEGGIPLRQVIAMLEEIMRRRVR